MVTFFMGSKPHFIGIGNPISNDDIGNGESPNRWGCGVVTCLDREGGLLQKNSDTLKVTKYPSNHLVTSMTSNEVTRYPKKLGVIKK